MVKFLQTGYAGTIRSKLGVTAGELPDDVINQRVVIDLAESTILKRVPSYDDITDDTDALLLEGAILSYACYLLAPGMVRRLHTEVTTVDVRWKKDKVNWNDLAQTFLAEVESQLSQITSVVVDENAGSEAPMLTILKGNVGRIV